MQNLLTEGTYTIPDDCTAKYEKRKIYVYKMKADTSVKRCRDCCHCKLGRLSMRRQFWDSTYCEEKPKTIAGKDGYYYSIQGSRIACNKFKDKV